MHRSQFLARKRNRKKADLGERRGELKRFAAFMNAAAHPQSEVPNVPPPNACTQTTAEGAIAAANTRSMQETR